MPSRITLLAITLLAQLASAPLALAGGNGRQCAVPQHGIGGTGAPTEIAHGIGGTGAPADSSHGIGGTGAPAETAHGIGGTGKQAEGGDGIGGTGKPAEVAHGIGGTGAPAETAHGIGGTGKQAEGGDGIGGTGIEVAALVTELTGSALLVDANHQIYMLSKGSTVCPGDRIETGAQASARISFPDGATLYVRPSTRLQIDQYAWLEQNPAGSRFLMTLIDGGLRAVSGKLGKANPESHRLSAPNATVTPLGTDYQVMTVNSETDGNEPGTYASVNSGRIRLANPLGELILDAGESGMIKVNRAPAKLPSWQSCR